MATENLNKYKRKTRKFPIIIIIICLLDHLFIFDEKEKKNTISFEIFMQWMIYN